MSEKHTISLVGLDAAVESALSEQLGGDARITVVRAADAQETRDVAASAVIVAGAENDLAALRRSAPGACLIAVGQAGDADAVFTPPFRIGRLLARIDAALAQTTSGAGGTIPIGPWFLRAADKQLTGGGGEVGLTDKETEVLLYLHDNRHRVVGRDELLEKIWRYSDAMSTHTLETHIYRLRRKIEPDSAQPSVLLTESGGYRLAPQTD